MYITVNNKEWSSDIRLRTILNSTTKANMLKVCKTLDLYVSPNLKKDITSQRLADEMLSEPCSILHQLCKSELRLLKRIIDAGPNQYVQIKARKTLYKLQKFGLVLTYEDIVNGEWHLLMPDEVREALAPDCQFYLDIAEKGGKGPSPKELRMMSFLSDLYGEREKLLNDL